jgi:hypothetical protein
MFTRASVAGLTFAALTGVAIAANVHFVKGPSFVDNGVTLTASGKLAGLGEGDVTIIVDATGTAAVECRNPGGNIAPGQSQTITTSGSQTLASAKNGTVTFGITTGAPEVSSSACPNDKWTPEVTDVQFSSALITVVQGGQIVLQQNYTF